MFFQIPVLPHAVQQEDAAFLDAPQQVVLVHIGLVVAGDEVGIVDEVGRADGRLPKRRCDMVTQPDLRES